MAFQSSITSRVSSVGAHPGQTSPGDPSMQGVFRECNDCGLTWLVSPNSHQGANPHPYHNALTRPNHPYPWCSIVVQIDSIYTRQSPDANNPTAIGVYFATGSRYNISSRRSIQSGIAAELEAAFSALLTVFNEVIPTRQNAFSERLGHERDGKTLRLIQHILCTD